MSPSLRSCSLVMLATACVSCASASGDVVLEWNLIASDVLRDNTTLQNPGMASRSLAMMNLAIHDAFASTRPGGTTFYDYGSGHASPGLDGLSVDAAIASAAHTVLSGVYGDQQSALDSHRDAQFALIQDGPAKTDAIALGSAVGQSILARRVNDGYDSMSQYMPSDDPGRWRPDPLNPGQEAWGPAWGEVAPFALQSNRQFVAPPMPALDSQEYAEAYNEVKELGAVNSATRTNEQTEIGLFWAYDRVGMGTPHRLFNRALRDIAQQEGNSLEENARLFAMASVAVADAGVLAWNSKFEYDFWRPVTGIREGDSDGNDLTIADPDWTPLGAPGGDESDFTPPFPTYVSGHATFGGALFGAMAEFYGTDAIAFSLESEEMEGAAAVRSFDTLSEAMAENGRSRVYLGIHWNFDDTVGQELGVRVAEYLFARPFVDPVPEPTGFLLASLLFAAAATKPARRRCAV